ncbi:MAG: acyl-CoA dehydrogenase family protein [Acidobacteria bacterium]|nr:acyl-CoA dehydrogenase family protein [Acidobacteriota bacterium]
MPETPMLSTYLDPSHISLDEQVEQFASREIEPRSTEQADYIPQAFDFLKRMASEGLLRYVAPAAYGGVHPHLDIRSLCLIRQGLARHSGLADTMFAMQGLGSCPITIAGNEEQKQRFLPKVVRGEAVATFALTEPEAGSDAAGLRTTARREGNEYRLDGSKRFISNAGIADFYVVFAKTDPEQGRKGISAIVVEKDRPGLTTRAQEVIAPHPIGEVIFSNCRVPAENLLSAEGEGWSILLRTLESFRTAVGAAALGMGERALIEASSYMKTRVQFGKTLSEFQGLRFGLAEMAMELEAARLLVYQAAWSLDFARKTGVSGGGASKATERALILSSSMAKLYATEAAQRVIDRGLQMHGGLGVVKGSVVERLYREIRALRVYEGTSEIQKEIIAHQLLKP